MMRFHNTSRVVSIANDPIELVTSFKLLGLHVQNNCKWDIQISFAISKASKRIFPLITLRRVGVSNSILWKVYKTHLRSIISYGFPSYCNVPQLLFKKLQKFEKRVQMCIGSSPSTSLAPFCEELCLKLTQKIEHNSSHPLRPLYDTVDHQHNLRKRNGSRVFTIAAPHCRTTRRKNSILRFVLYV